MCPFLNKINDALYILCLSTRITATAQARLWFLSTAKILIFWRDWQLLENVVRESLSYIREHCNILELQKTEEARIYCITIARGKCFGLGSTLISEIDRIREAACKLMTCDTPCTCGHLRSLSQSE